MSSSSQPLLHTHNTQNSNPLSPPTYKSVYLTCHQKTKSFLSSRYQHYLVLGLVACDLLGIFADILIQLYQCDVPDASPRWNNVKNGLGIAGLVFSSLFMLELMLNVWIFGWRYFSSRFHTFDALVIVVGFFTDVLLHGTIEEVASLVVVLRLWRFFKIIEEFSVGAEEQMDGLEKRIGELEEENARLKGLLRKGKRDEEAGESELA
ncbi:hypothetical protein BKA64DRAFT_652032 [Cadophora sp. MPI-SDFR-AT-0126]|nr:hypothetical protein BKA64DRAFT_652032 [Leotiomycetes sp. MPI-SDFR-AT-0126]